MPRPSTLHRRNVRDRIFQDKVLAAGPDADGAEDYRRTARDVPGKVCTRLGAWRPGVVRSRPKRSDAQGETPPQIIYVYRKTGRLLVEGHDPGRAGGLAGGNGTTRSMSTLHWSGRRSAGWLGQSFNLRLPEATSRSHFPVGDYLQSQPCGFCVSSRCSPLPSSIWG
jgi:hypothetical protein